MDNEKTKLLNEFLDDYLIREPFSGSIRVTCKDEILFERFVGMANKEQAIPFTRNSLFTLYSITKAFTAIGLMRLKDKGLVDLDAHPSVYVPEMKACHQDLTVRDLLYHTSGLPDFLLTPGFKETYLPGTPDKIREHLEIISHYPIHFEPGQSAEYCNINFIICALIIENISGLSFPAYMAQEVFAPLGAKTARIEPVNVPYAHKVQGYSLADGQVIPVERCTDWMYGAGDAVGTVDDVYTLNKAIKEELLLSPESWQTVLSPCVRNKKGMGCTVTKWHGKHRITHNGGHRGFRTLHVHLPEDDFDVIILSNTGWGEGRKDILEKIHEIYYGNNAQPSDAVEMDKGYV